MRTQNVIDSTIGSNDSNIHCNAHHFIYIPLFSKEKLATRTLKYELYEVDTSRLTSNKGVAPTINYIIITRSDKR